MSGRRTAWILLAGVALGCGAPEPEPGPEPRLQVSLQTRQPAAPPPEGPVEIVISADTFPDDLLERVDVGDLVEVDLQKGGRARGWVRTIQPREMTVSSEGTSVLTRLTPEVVAHVEVVYRPPDQARLVTGDDPRDSREMWLERFLQWPALEGEPSQLWGGRFGDNIPLVVSRAFDLPALRFSGRRGSQPFFEPLEGRVSLEPNDQLKLMSVTTGLQPAASGDRATECTGEVYLYLHRRGADVIPIFTTEPVARGNVTRESLERFLRREPLTFVVSRPGSPSHYLKIARAPASVVRSYMRTLDRIPDRPAMRRMRAAKDAELAAAEALVRRVYATMGLKKEAELDVPLLFEFRYPVLPGGLRLVQFRKEVGLD